MLLGLEEIDGASVLSNKETSCSSAVVSFWGNVVIVGITVVSVLIPE
jgi:hypothetical protein